MFKANNNIQITWLILQQPHDLKPFNNRQIIVVKNTPVALTFWAVSCYRSKSGRTRKPRYSFGISLNEATSPRRSDMMIRMPANGLPQPRPTLNQTTCEYVYNKAVSVSGLQDSEFSSRSLAYQPSGCTDKPPQRGWGGVGVSSPPSPGWSGGGGSICIVTPGKSRW